MAHRRDVAGLLGVAAIALLDGDAEEHARAADLMRPDRGHVGHAGRRDVLADQRRAGDGAIARLLFGRALRRAADHDRVVAVVDGLDVEHRLLADVAAVVAGPFAERPFQLAFARLHEAFDDHLGVGRNRQTSDRALDHLDRLAAQAAGDIQFAHAVGHFAAGYQELQRVAADDDGHRHRLVPRLVLVAMDAPVLARGHIEAQRVLVVDHHPVGADVDPVLFGIAGDVVAAGADVASAVGFVPERDGEFGDVDGVAGEHVLHHRAGLDELMGDGLQLAHVVFEEGLGELELVEFDREAQGEVLALAAEEIGQDARALLGAGDVFEDHARRVLVVLDEFGGHADVFLPGGALDVPDLAQFLGFRNPFAQVFVGDFEAQRLALALGFLAGRRSHRTAHRICALLNRAHIHSPCRRRSGHGTSTAWNASIEHSST